VSEARVQSVNFDTPPRANASGENAGARIAAVVRHAQADAPDALYNEALTLARADDLAAAGSRLQMLLVLDPDDAQGRLLLARVLAAQGRGIEAHGHVEFAAALGVDAPDDLRAAVEESARLERQRSDEARARAGAREAGELRALRAEARTLRSDALRLEAEVSEAQRREGRWRWMSMGMAAVSMLVLVAVAVKVRSSPATVTAPSSEAESRLSLALEHGAGDRTASIIGEAPTDRKSVALPPPDAAASGGGVAEGGGPPSAPENAASTDATKAPVAVVVPPSESVAPVVAKPSSKTVETPAPDAEKADAAKVDAKKEKSSDKKAATTREPKADTAPETTKKPATKAESKSSTATKTAKTTKTTKTTADTTSASGSRGYVVKSGDTLGSIALKYYGKASAADRIRKANHSALKKGLKPGMKLIIP
jgi:LysM repeat protein